MQFALTRRANQALEGCCRSSPLLTEDKKDEEREGEGIKVSETVERYRSRVPSYE